MKNNHPSPSFESVNAFGQRLSAACATGTPEMITLSVYATPADYHKLRPELSHIPHALYLQSVSSGVEAAKQHGVPLLMKELKSEPYRAWLDHHSLENTIPHCFLYACFAPVLKDPALLLKLAVPHVDAAEIHQASVVTGAIDPRVADLVEECAVQAMVEQRCNHPLHVLTHLHVMVSQAPNPVLAAASWALADRVGAGMPRKLVSAVRDTAKTIAAQLETDPELN